jgi:hypothetical protein
MYKQRSEEIKVYLFKEENIRNEPYLFLVYILRGCQLSPITFRLIVERLAHVELQRNCKEACVT